MKEEMLVISVFVPSLGDNAAAEFEVTFVVPIQSQLRRLLSKVLVKFVDDLTGWAALDLGTHFVP